MDPNIGSLVWTQILAALYGPKYWQLGMDLNIGSLVWTQISAYLWGAHCKSWERSLIVLCPQTRPDSQRSPDQLFCRLGCGRVPTGALLVCCYTGPAGNLPKDLRSDTIWLATVYTIWHYLTSYSAPYSVHYLTLSDWPSMETLCLARLSLYKFRHWGCNVVLWCSAMQCSVMQYSVVQSTALQAIREGYSSASASVLLVQLIGEQVKLIHAHWLHCSCKMHHILAQYRCEGIFWFVCARFTKKVLFPLQKKGTLLCST